MTDYKLKTPKAAESVLGAYQKVEDGVVGAYKKVENGFVGTYKKIEGKFVDAFLEEVPDSVHQSSDAVKEVKASMAAEEGTQADKEDPAVTENGSSALK